MSSQINGYVQVEINGKQAIGHIFPPKEGGLPINAAEVDEYLFAHGFSDYDKGAFRRQLAEPKESTFAFGNCDGLEFSETMNIKISLDKMRVTCRFMPPSMNGSRMNAKDIMGELSKRGVVYGIDQDAILAYLSDPCYATDYVFAEGLQPVIGRDAKIEYFFNTKPSLKPKHNEDGSVDYRDLNTICGVKEGDLLARLTPEDRGKPGKNVCGQDIPTRTVKSKHLEFGQNIRISDDRTEIYAAVTGHVSLVNEKVFVSDVYDVPADVDNSIGNINYDGNVHIHGNVRGGFSVVARGDVIVDGVVEDALIQAGGQIIVKRGIHGMRRGILDAKGNVIVQFIENAKVFSGGYVETGSIIYSEVNASEDIIVIDKKGFIAGGSVRAGGKVESMTIGSDMGAMTHIEVGMAPEKKERYTQLHKSITSLTKKINKLTPVIKTYNDFVESGKALDHKNMLYLNKLMSELRSTKDMLQDCRVEFNALHQELINSKHAKVIVRRDIHSGVMITISDLSMTMKDKRSYCQFEKKNGEILVTNL